VVIDDTFSCGAFFGATAALGASTDGEPDE